MWHGAQPESSAWASWTPSDKKTCGQEAAGPPPYMQGVAAPPPYTEQAPYQQQAPQDWWGGSKGQQKGYKGEASAYNAGSKGAGKQAGKGSKGFADDPSGKGKGKGKDSFAPPQTSTTSSRRLGHVIWYTVHPRNGELQPYPKEIAEWLEGEYTKGEPSVNLGAHFHNSTVFFRDQHGQPKMTQKTETGVRDVGRGVTHHPASPICAWVTSPYQGMTTKAWKACREEDPGAQRRQLSGGGNAVEEKEMQDPQLQWATQPTQQWNQPAPGVMHPASQPWTPPAPPKTWVVWLSVDPSSGQLQIYPATTAKVIEVSYQNSAGSVCLGDAYQGRHKDKVDSPVIVLQPKLEQRTATGRRDIARRVVEDPEGYVSVGTFQAPGGAWHVAEDEAYGSTMRTQAAQIARMRLRPGDAIESMEAGPTWPGIAAMG